MLNYADIFHHVSAVVMHQETDMGTVLSDTTRETVALESCMIHFIIRRVLWPYHNVSFSETVSSWEFPGNCIDRVMLG